MKRRASLILALLLCVLCGCASKSSVQRAEQWLAEHVSPVFGAEWVAVELYSSHPAFTEAWAEDVDRCLQENTDTFTPIDAARIVWALAETGYPVPEALLSRLEPASEGAINTAVWALLALDAAAPEGMEPLRNALVDRILLLELEGGGFAFSGSAPDSDMTAMAVRALLPYERAEDAVQRALAVLYTLWDSENGWSGYGVPNAESCAQVIQAFCAAGIDPSVPLEGGEAPIDYLLRYQNPDGGFGHTTEAASSAGSTVQALQALHMLEEINHETA